MIVIRYFKNPPQASPFQRGKDFSQQAPSAKYGFILIEKYVK